VSPSVDLQDVVIEILDSEAEAGDSHVPDGPEFIFIERSGFTLEGDFLRLVPRDDILHAFCERRELLGREVAGSAASKVDELWFTALDVGLFCVGFQFLDGRIQILLDFRRILIRVDSEIAKVASFAAEGDMEVEPQGYILRGRAVEQRVDAGDILFPPEGERRVVGDEIITGLSFFLICLGHAFDGVI
jgi:hypothetical protein